MVSKKNIGIVILLSIVSFAGAQNPKTIEKMDLIKLTDKNELMINPSATSSPDDFNFLEGKWNVHNQKLKARLNNSNEWDEFESIIQMKKALNGNGNVENYYASFDGKPFEGLAVRLFNPKTKLWKIYWMDTGGGVMDEHPVTGSFENKIGRFYAKDIFNGKNIVVLYQWDSTNPKQPVWSQAFSADNGKTWEWNWRMTLTRIE